MYFVVILQSKQIFFFFFSNNNKKILIKNNNVLVLKIWTNENWTHILYDRRVDVNRCQLVFISFRAIQ